MQGVNLTDLKDKDGKFYIRERLEMIKAKGKGWQDYYFVNPVNKEIELKSMYCEKYDELAVCAGIYKKK
jgi:signal transduction histidine kinase